MAGAKQGVIERDKRSVAIAQILAVLIPLLVYLTTLARDVTFIDSGELAAAAAHLGIAHPPGYPLFTLLGHVFALLPVGSVIFRVGLMSALAGAVTTGLLFRAAWTLVGDDTPAGWPRRLAVFGTLSGTLLYAFAATPWSQAVIVEVYALHTALVMAVLAACLAIVSRTRSVSTKNLILVGFLFGLSLTNHLTAALLGLALVTTLVFLSRDQRRPEASRYRIWLRTILAVPLPILLYAYLPIRSRMNPLVNWDYPETWHRFMVHISARQYQGIWGREGLNLEELHRFITEQLFADATPVLPVMALLGLLILARTRPRVLWLTVPLFFAQLVYNLGYPIDDIRVYYLLPILLLSLWAAVAAAWISRRISHFKFHIAVPVLILLFLFPMFALKQNFARNDLSRYRVASAFVHDVVLSAEPGSVIFSGDWELFSGPMVYLQKVANFRPDITVLDMGRLANPMLARDLEDSYPELGMVCKEKLTAMAEVAHKAERGEYYNINKAQNLFKGMQRSLARESVRLRPTYALGLAFQHDMFTGLDHHPEGLLVRMAKDPGFRALPLLKFKLPGVLSGREPDIIERELLSLYLNMLAGRARYLDHHGHAEAADSLRAYLAHIRR